MTHAQDPALMVDADGIAAPEAIAGVVATGMPGPLLQATAASVASGLEVSEASVAELLSRDDGRVLVLYQSPWEAFLEAASKHRFATGDEALAWLREWRRVHERILEDREIDPQRVLLVNSARLAPDCAELRAALGIEAARAGDCGMDPLVGEYASLLSYRMEAIGPEFWEVYEALESVALLLGGREAEFRGARPPAREEQLRRSLSLWSDAVAARILDRQSGSPDAAAADADQIERLELANATGARALEEMRLENELLGHMIQQMQGELAFHVRSNEELQEALAASSDAAERARLRISRLVSPQDS
jgi:hypothetical protein